MSAAAGAWTARSVRPTRANSFEASASEGCAVGHAVRDRSPSFLDRLQPFPVLVDLIGAGDLGVGEHVRVPADELVDEVRRHLVDRKGLGRRQLGGQPSMEQHLQQQVAELLAKQWQVGGLDRLERLVRLFEQVSSQRIVRLLGVPGAAARRSQAVHHLDGAVEGAELSRHCQPRQS